MNTAHTETHTGKRIVSHCRFFPTIRRQLFKSRPRTCVTATNRYNIKKHPHTPNTQPQLIYGSIKFPDSGRAFIISPGNYHLFILSTSRSHTQGEKCLAVLTTMNVALSPSPPNPFTISPIVRSQRSLRSRLRASLPPPPKQGIHPHGEGGSISPL